MERTDRDRLILEEPEKMCESCCNFDKEHIGMDGTALCKLTMTLAYAEDYGGNCMFCNVPKEQIIVPPKEEKKMVYFPFPIECENCSKVTEIGVCEELGLLYAGKHPKYSKEQDWEFMCANCPHEVHEREYMESDEKHIGKTVFLTKEEAEEKLKELGK